MGRRWTLSVGLALGVVVASVLMAEVGQPASGASTYRSANAVEPGARGPAWQGTRTVTYCLQGGRALPMTLFAPTTATAHPVPAVLQVHGGGWQEGSRLLSLSGSGTATDLVNAGFVVASIDYRLAPENPWPDQIEDVKCAVRFLRAHATDLGIDPEQIAALGTSAGGQLVSLLGTTGSSPLWDTGSFPNVSSGVEAVVDEFGPSDLSATGWPPDSSAMIRRVFGAAPGATNPALVAASPLLHVAAGDPPFLIVQGTDDQVVPPSQSERFASQLRAAGVPVQLVLVDHGRHGLETPGEEPSQPAIDALITAYLQHVFHR